jgi:hypothetical protein
MRMPARIAESSKCSTVPENTSVHHGEYTRTDSLLRRHIVYDAILQPYRRKAKPDAIIDDGGNMLGATKDIYDINPLAGLQDVRQMIEVGNGLLAEDGVGRGRYGDNAVAESLKVSGHAVARLRSIGRQSNNRDDARGVEQLGYLVRGWVLEHVQSPR